MPQTGQDWQPGLFSRSALLSRFLWLDESLDTRADWPSLDEFTALAEGRRRAFNALPSVALPNATAAPPPGLEPNTGAPTTDALTPIRFVTPEPKRSRAPRTQPIDIAALYDGRIALRHEVPCYPASYHDLFNVLIWSAFPRAKRALHERQYRALKAWVPAGAVTLPGKRTREQDALTVFDEGGSVVVLSAEAHASFMQAVERGVERHPIEHAECVLFGHALLEHVFHGRPCVRSSALLLVGNAPSVPAQLFAWLDEQVCARLCSEQAFRAPGADVVVTLEQDQQMWLGPNLPAPDL